MLHTNILTMSPCWCFADIYRVNNNIIYNILYYNKNDLIYDLGGKDYDILCCINILIKLDSQFELKCNIF